MRRLSALAVGLLALGCGEVGTKGLASSETGASATVDTAPPDCPLDACFGDCTDLETDADNCGGCGVTCLATRGRAACRNGTCILAECDDGWGDCDGDPDNGCETQSTCVSGSTCDTECGSEGSLVCNDACAPTCVAPLETCNAQDDDCDGECDEGGLTGCRESVYRSHGPLGHVYGVDSDEPARLGQTTERDPFFYIYAEETPGLVPLYRCDKGGGRRFLTTSSSCEIGVAPEMTMGWVAASERCGAIPVYRLYSAAASNHFYTTSATERDNAVSVYGYLSEGVAAWVWAAP